MLDNRSVVRSQASLEQATDGVQHTTGGILLIRVSSRVSVGLIGKLQNLQDPSLSCQISPRGKVFSRSDPALDPY
jgi:hypothetical protein